MPKQASSITDLLSSLSSLAEANPSRPVRAPLRIHFPGSGTSPTIVSSPGTSVSKDAAALPPSYSISATCLSNITVPNCDLSPVSSHSSSSFSSFQPGTSRNRRGSGASNSAGQIPHYLVVCLDLDPPFPSFPVLAPTLHSLEADLRLETEELDVDEGYVYLTANEVAGGPEGISHSGTRATKPVVGYMGPKPPGVSAPHRYVFLCWEQPGGVDSHTIREALGLGAEQEIDDDADDVGMARRVRWDQEGFERKLGLGKVVAGNYFVC